VGKERDNQIDFLFGSLEWYTKTQSEEDEKEG
jgi:hypothetical protein